MQYAKFGDRDASPYRLPEDGNRTVRLGPGGKVVYRGYAIEPKRDFGGQGHLIYAHEVKHGYVVTDGGIVNVMPGATWFLTVVDAMRAIDDLITSESLGPGPTGEHPFWALHRFRNNCEERAPELATLLQEIVNGLDPVKTDPRLQGVIGSATALLDQIDANCDRRDTIREVGGEARKVGERQTGRFGF